MLKLLITLLLEPVLNLRVEDLLEDLDLLEDVDFLEDLDARLLEPEDLDLLEGMDFSFNVRWLSLFF